MIQIIDFLCMHMSEQKPANVHDFLEHRNQIVFIIKYHSIEILRAKCSFINHIVKLIFIKHIFKDYIWVHVHQI